MPAQGARNSGVNIHNSRSRIQFVDTRESPLLLPIFRSQQQAELLAMLLGELELELSLRDLSQRCSVPYASVHREIERAEAAGLVKSRKIGNTRLVSADTASPYHEGLANVLTRAFGVPTTIATALREVAGVSAAYVFGSWAARHAGVAGARPVADIDLLVLGDPDRDELYAAIDRVAPKLGRQVQTTIRSEGWLETGDGSFHDTVVDRPMVKLDLGFTPGQLLGQR
jgi:predicted nucleotidyltransferase